MNVQLVSPAWRRYDVTRLALAERRWLCDELAARGLTAGSVIVADDDNLDIAHEYGFDTVEMDNSDLGRKFNAGYKRAAELGADVIVHVGSDDWVHPDMFDVLHQIDLEEPPNMKPTPTTPMVWRRAPQCVSHRRLSLVDLSTGLLQRCTVLGKYGCIPWLIPRSVMAPQDFQPIPSGLGRGIDGALVRSLKTRPNWIFQDVADEWCVDFKSPVNLTPYRGLARTLGYGEPLDAWETLAAKYPAHLVGMARIVHSSVAAKTRELAEKLRPIDEACDQAGIDLIVEYVAR